MRTRILKGEFKEVIYSNERWRILKDLRRRAYKIMNILNDHGITSYIFGSLARGDVHAKSDIDIVILHPPPLLILSYVIENNFWIYSRELVQATPNSGLKAYIYLDERTIISFPITKLNKREFEFYKFGGLLSFKHASDFKYRVPGVDKRFMFIKPTEQGHIEFSVIGRESEVSKELKISIETIEERKKIFLKRDEKGRTGLFIRVILDKDESFDAVLRELIDKKPAVRSLIKRRGLIV